MKKIISYCELIDDYIQFFDFSEYKQLKKNLKKQKKQKNLDKKKVNLKIFKLEKLFEKDNKKKLLANELIELKAYIFSPSLKNHAKKISVRLVFWDKLFLGFENFYWLINYHYYVKNNNLVKILFKIMNQIIDNKTLICTGFFNISDNIDIEKNIFYFKIIYKEELQIFPKKIYSLNQYNNLYKLLYLRYLKK